ncbi:MAG: hypothetical protein COA52_02625 [Hyphomicrobiales bacterium]|nr:MAG: hypothetical protein COA52_02625 [Hyphomicrobiales bacterium]
MYPKFSMLDLGAAKFGGLNATNQFGIWIFKQMRRSFHKGVIQAVILQKTYRFSIAYRAFCGELKYIKIALKLLWSVAFKTQNRTKPTWHLCFYMGLQSLH